MEPQTASSYASGPIATVHLDELKKPKIVCHPYTDELVPQLRDVGSFHMFHEVLSLAILSGFLCPRKSPRCVDLYHFAALEIIRDFLGIGPLGKHVLYSDIVSDVIEIPAECTS